MWKEETQDKEGYVYSAVRYVKGYYERWKTSVKRRGERRGRPIYTTWYTGRHLYKTPSPSPRLVMFLPASTETMSGITKSYTGNTKQRRRREGKTRYRALGYTESNTANIKQKTNTNVRRVTRVTCEWLLWISILFCNIHYSRTHTYTHKSDQCTCDSVSWKSVNNSRTVKDPENCE